MRAYLTVSFRMKNTCYTLILSSWQIVLITVHHLSVCISFASLLRVRISQSN